MKVYKFLDSQHAAMVAAGSLRFGTDRYYRMLERGTGDDAIGDCLEAVAITEAQPFVVDPAVHTADELRAICDEARRYKIDIGFVDEPGVNIRAKVTFINHFPCYILSLSGGEFSKLVSEMSDAPDGPRYGACVSFECVRTLAQLIWECGTCSIGGADSVPVREYFEQFAHGVVRYEALPNYEFGAGPIAADPFRKSKKYAGQGEVRIVLVPKVRHRHRMQDHLTVTCAPAAAIAKIEYSRTSSPAPADQPVDNVALIGRLHRLMQLIEQISAVRTSRENVIRECTDDVRRQVEGGEYYDGQREEEFRLFRPIEIEIFQTYWMLRKSLGRNEEMDDLLERGHDSFNQYPFMGRAIAHFLASHYDLLSQARGDLFPPIKGNKEAA